MPFFCFFAIFSYFSLFFLPNLLPFSFNFVKNGRLFNKSLKKVKLIEKESGFFAFDKKIMKVLRKRIAKVEIFLYNSRHQFMRKGLNIIRYLIICANVIIFFYR